MNKILRANIYKITISNKDKGLLKFTSKTEQLSVPLLSGLEF